MGDHSGANSRFAAPQDDGWTSRAEQRHFDDSVAAAALSRWVLNYGEQASCAVVPDQRGELRRAM